MLALMLALSIIAALTNSTQTTVKIRCLIQRLSSPEPNVVQASKFELVRPSCPDSRPHRAAVAHRPRRRGDRIEMLFVVRFGHKGRAMIDDQFRDLMRMLRLILMALALIAGLLAGFLWMLQPDRGVASPGCSEKG
jgi:hypothetical protein